MTLDQFWNIVDRVHRASGGDMDKQCQLLDAELRRLSLDEVLSFDGIRLGMYVCSRDWRALGWVDELSANTSEASHSP